MIKKDKANGPVEGVGSRTLGDGNGNTLGPRFRKPNRCLLHGRGCIEKYGSMVSKTRLAHSPRAHPEPRHGSMVQ